MDIGDGPGASLDAEAAIKIVLVLPKIASLAKPAPAPFQNLHESHFERTPSEPNQWVGTV